MKDTLYIIYGSRTGNSRSIAEMTQRYAKHVGLESCLLEMKAMDFEIINKLKYALLIVSTHGEGDPPAVAMDFYNYMHKEDRENLSGLKFAMLALGDSSYKDYCKTGKDFEIRLLQLGATKLIPLRECDVDFEETARKWIENTVGIFCLEISGKEINKQEDFSFDFYADALSVNGDFQVEVKEKRNLCSSESTKRTLHFVLSSGNVEKEYLPGDSIAVRCSNSRLYVDRLLKELKFDGTHPIRNKERLSLLKQVLINDYELSLITPVVLKKYAELVDVEALNVIVENKTKMDDYCTQHDILDMISDFSADYSPENFLSVLRKLKPRLYSVASSSKAHPKELHLTMGVMEYTLKDRSRIGITSSYLSDRTEVGERLTIHLENNDSFRLPKDGNTPIILIGSGTGIAAYRSFLQDREASDAKGDIWLIFGERNSESDFLYREELLDYKNRGLLTRLDTAFSRDQEEKIYVQDKIREHADDIYEWLINRGASIYICGNKRTMAVGVRNALMNLFYSEGKMNQPEARDLIKKLKSEKRWQEDVY
ncbi:diflavin oxidoreductase [Ancylomarina sp. YFZ004]